MANQPAFTSFKLSEQLGRQRIPVPVFRKLRVFAMDPGLTARFETAVMNEMTLEMPWEKLKPGPKGEYIAVVDVDNQGELVFVPVDLDRPDLLAQDGRAPSDGDLHFHQQMVYAVAMRTIRTFEIALGRLIHWPQKPMDGQPCKDKYQPHMTIYPHWFQGANARYSIDNNSIELGYFAGSSSLTGSINIFTCLSQDAIAHQVTSAVLLGMNLRDNSSPGWAIRWMPALRTLKGMPNGGSNLVILAKVKKDLHLRIFDENGRCVVQADSANHIKKANEFAQLEKLLKPFGRNSQLSDKVEAEVLELVWRITEFEDLHEVDPDEMAFLQAFADLVALFLHFWECDVLRMQIAAIRGRFDVPSPLGAVALQLGQALGNPDGLRNAFGKTIDGVWTPRRDDPNLGQSEKRPHERGNILVGAVFDAFRRIYESRVADLRRIGSKGTGEIPPGDLHPDLVNRLTHEAAQSAQLVLEMCIRALDYLPPVRVTFGDFLRAILTADHDLNPDDPQHFRQAFVQTFRANGICPNDIRTVSAHTLLWPAPETYDQERSLQPFVNYLSRSLPYWNLSRKRAELWCLLEEKKQELHQYLSTAPWAPESLGVIDLTQPFEVLALYPHYRARSAGDSSSQWVVKLVQSIASPNGTPGETQVGTTLLIDADTGLIRYLINKPSPLNAKRALDAPLLSPLFPPIGRDVWSQRQDERRLRVFAFDPAAGISTETAGINEVTLLVPWERDSSGTDIMLPGPVGEYLEVVDRDPASRAFYSPVDLNEPHLIAQNGLSPSESNPQFHQQMVYAVAMRTIRTFERALGRLALWSPRPSEEGARPGEVDKPERYVRRLRIYPHALREANAYYSPTKKAVLFGYFPASNQQGAAHAGSMTVFTCLSHDIIAHEVTHALLDGMHRRFSEATNPDVLAFHEAFADVVALFQHFSLPQILRHQIAATRGDLESQNRLGELAQQFGQATGKRGALRNALGRVNPVTRQWERAEPDPEAYGLIKEPHDRGALLVAAIFDAFLTIYKSSVADLLRIASQGTGILPAGQIHPDLVDRLADEGAKAAVRVLNMCIRALDYCPPVDMTFGEYLRAIVTADYEFDPVDKTHCRVAFVEAFRRHGILPDDVRTVSVEGLLWMSVTDAPGVDENVKLELVREWVPDIADWNLTKDREALYNQMRDKRAALNLHLKSLMEKGAAIPSGIVRELKFEVHSIRPSFRSDWEGRPRFQWIIEVTQRVGEFVDPPSEREPNAEPDYYFRGGCTLVVDAETGCVRFNITKTLNKARRDRQRQYLTEDDNPSLAATYSSGSNREQSEPFAMLHRH